MTASGPAQPLPWTPLPWTPLPWTKSDLQGTARAFDAWWALLVDGLDESILRSAPAPGEPSVLELRAKADRALAGGRYDVAAVERGLSALSRAGRMIAASGAGVPSQVGTVVGVHVSDGGVPKRAVPEATVGVRGLEGDRQAARKHHGRVWQALCLWSADVIAVLQDEGHPIAPGNAGENLTLAGLDWAALRPGTRLQLGGGDGAAVAELSLPALPCRKNARWFRDGDMMRMWHERHPGEARWYASVVTPGRVRPGDRVTVEP